MPGAEHAQRQECHGQQDHEQADAVDAQMVGQTPLRHPGRLLHELEPARSEIETRQRKRQRDLHQPGGQGQPADGLLALHHEQRQGRRQGEEDERAQDRKG